MFDCLVLCKPIITYIWLSVCLISIKQSLLFFLHWFLWKLAYIFSLVVWLFDSRQTMYNVNVYDWKQTCLHLAFRFITFVMHFIFTIFFVRPQPCMLEFGREFFRWWTERASEGDEQCHPTCTRLVFLSDALQR